MQRDEDWSGRKSHFPFFLHHEFLIPAFLFSGMLVTEKVRLSLAVMGIKIYDESLINPLLFYSGILYIAVSYSFRSFMRWSRFRLSQYHPLVNFILNILLTTLPIATMILNPLLVLPLLGIHWYSHIRAPDVAEAKGRIGFLSRTYTLILAQMAICFAAYFLVLYDIPTIRELTLWRWARQ